VNSGRWQVSSDGGTRPVWSRSGRELFFLTGANRMAAVAVQPGATFNYSKAQPLFSVPTTYAYSSNVSPSPFRSFDVSSDGKRFLMVKTLTTSETGARLSLVVVQNWFTELKSRMPSR
jgi:hypothetical protein